MAFSFTLPELRAELRALGYDGLPDHLILSFLSQLHLPHPSSASPSETSDYDTEASTCSTHSLSCGYGSSKDRSLPGELTGVRGPEGCADSLSPSPRARKASSDLGHCGPDDGASCAKASSLRSRKFTADLGGGTACRLGDGIFGDGNTMQIRCSSKLHDKLLCSGLSVEREEVLNRREDAEDIPNVAKSVDLVCGHLDESRPASPGHSGKTGSRLSISHLKKGAEVGKEGNTDNIIEHYWISVGEEHMRAMHSKMSSKKKEQLKEPSVLESHGDASTSSYGCFESKNGCESLIAKVQRCENELQCLNLSLQAQQCKKPWFLEADQKPRVFHKEKHDFCSKSALSDSMPASDSAVQIVEGGEKCSFWGEPSMVTGVNTEIIEDAFDRASGNQCFSSLEHANDCVEAQSKIPTMAEEQPQQMLLSKVEEGDTLEANLAVILSVGDGGEAHQIEDMADKELADITPEQNNDPEHSVCSKSSSASYQHSRSSDDSRSNGSQQLSIRLSSRKQQQHKKRGGKIDRVARFAEMQRLWKKDTFLAANEAGGKRKGIQSFHHLFSSLHNSSTY